MTSANIVRRDSTCPSAVSCAPRTGRFREYHTSADNLDFVEPAALEESLAVLTHLMEVLDQDRTLVRLDGRGEPQLGGAASIGRSAARRKPAAPTSWPSSGFSIADGRHSCSTWRSARACRSARRAFLRISRSIWNGSGSSIPTASPYPARPLP